MAIFKLDIVDIELNNGSVHRSFMSKTLGEGDKQANRFGVHLLRNGEEVSLEDATCTGYFIRADGGTVVIPGIVNENLAYVRLPETCYAIEGQFSLAIKVESGTVIGTMRIIDGVVANVSTDAIVDPGTILPSIEDLIDAIDEAVSSIPADYSGLWECLAPNYSNAKLYRKGQYCTYDGGVYRCLINIEATENWKPAHWQQVTIGDQLMSVMETNPENKWTAGDLVIPEDDGYLNLADIDEGISLPAGTYNLSGVAFSEGANTDIRFRFNAGGDTVNVDLAADGLFHDTTFTLSAAATLIRVQTGHTVETSEGFGGYLNHVTLIEADSSAGFIPNITAVDSIARLPNVYPSGLTDGTDADNMINAIRLTGGYCKLAPGTYYIDVMAFPSTPATIEGSGKETVIVVDKDADYTYGIRLSNNSAIRHLTVKSSDSTYTPADIYTGTVKNGINIRPATGTGKTHVSIEDVTVENFSGAGILLNQTGQDSDDGCHVLNCFVSNCGAGIWTNTNAEFNRIDCCNFASCYYGAINDGGNNVFSNCGFSGNKYGFFMDNTSGNLSNNSHGSVIGCVFNHEDYDSTTLGKGYGIYLIGVTSGMQFVGGQLFYAGIYLKDCTAVVISNFNFGKMIENSTDVGVKIEVVRTSGNRLLLLTDSVFAIAPRITATSSANQKVFVNSCYTRDGALIPSITPGFTPTTEIAPQYSASSTYAVGQYVFYNGELKRCTTAITTAEAYTAAHWTDVTLANDVSDLKSAIDSNQLELSTFEDNGYSLLTRGNFERDVYNPATGYTSDYKYRISARNEIVFSYDVKIVIASGFRLYPYTKNESNVWTGRGWQTGSYDVEANVPFYCQIGRTTENTSETADIQEFISKATVIRLDKRAVVTPQMFGAKANGTDDDTSFIEQALAKGDIIVFPYGTYKITTTITVPSNKTLVGNGSTITASGIIPFTINQKYNVDIGGFKCYNCEKFIFVYYSSNIRIHNIEVTSSSYAFYFERMTYFDIKDIYIFNEGSTTDGLHFNNGCAYGNVESVFGYTGDDFIALNASEHEYAYSSGINHISFKKCVTSSPVYSAVRIYGADSKISNITFSGCRFIARSDGSSQAQAIRFTNAVSGAGDSTKDNNAVGDIVFENCYIQTLADYQPISIAYSNIENLIFENCKFVRSAYTSTNMFISVSGTSEIGNLKVINCIFNNPSTNIVILFTYGDTAIKNLIIENTDYDSSYNETGVIRIGGSADNVYIDKCHFEKIKYVLHTFGEIQSMNISNCSLDTVEILIIASAGSDISSINISNIHDIAPTGSALIAIGNTQTGCGIAVNSICTSRAVNVRYVGVTSENVRYINGVKSYVAPGSALAGDEYIYISDGSAECRFYDGTEWKKPALESV